MEKKATTANDRTQTEVAMTETTNKDGIEGIVMDKDEFDATVEEMITVRLDSQDDDELGIYDVLLDYFPEQVAEVHGPDSVETFEEALARKCREWDVPVE
jgi:hypothetical protein